MKILAVLTVRNEAAYLLEWLAHHQAAGITDFLVFSNDCDDGTDQMLDRLAEMGLVTHVRNDGPHDKGGIQFTAMKLADKRPEVAAADWIVTLDIDEFINIHVDNHTVPALLTALPEASAITLTWRLFGSSDIVRYEDRPVTEQFTRAAPEVMYWPWRASMFKTLFRNDGTYRKLGIHRPRNPAPERVHKARWFDGAGRELPPQFLKRQIFSPFGRRNFDLAQLNHYPLGSMENFVLKADRGRAVHGADMLDLDYWVERNYNTDTDTSVAALGPERDAAFAALKSDARLGALHNEAVAWRKARFDTLMQEEPYRALFGRLLQTPPSRPVRPEEARLLVQHARLRKARDTTDGSRR